MESGDRFLKVDSTGSVKLVATAKEVRIRINQSLRKPKPNPNPCSDGSGGTGPKKGGGGGGRGCFEDRGFRVGGGKKEHESGQQGKEG